MSALPQKTEIRTMMNDPNDMIFQEVDASRRRDLEGRGGPKFCWCMAWRPKLSGRLDNETKKGLLKQSLDCGNPIGVLGYLGGEPVAWRSVAPRETYRRVSRIADPEGVRPADVWAVAHFFVYRFMGLVPAFESMGFEDVGMAGRRRHVLRLAVGRDDK